MQTVCRSTTGSTERKTPPGATFQGSPRPIVNEEGRRGCTLEDNLSRNRVKETVNQERLEA
jgi:hypothetical protein